MCSQFTAHAQEEITDALEKVCSRLPAHSRQECDEFVTKYFERVLDLFLKGVARIYLIIYFIWLIYIIYMKCHR